MGAEHWPAFRFTFVKGNYLKKRQASCLTHTIVWCIQLSSSDVPLQKVYTRLEMRERCSLMRSSSLALLLLWQMPPTHAASSHKKKGSKWKATVIQIVHPSAFCRFLHMVCNYASTFWIVYKKIAQPSQSSNVSLWIEASLNASVLPECTHEK